MNAPTIYLTSIVAGTFTNNEGEKLYSALAPYLASGTQVRLSLLDATPMSSSFLNSSFGELIEQYGMAVLRHSLKLTDYLPSHALTIKNYTEAVRSELQLT